MLGSQTLTIVPYTLSFLTHLKFFVLGGRWEGVYLKAKLSVISWMLSRDVMYRMVTLVNNITLYPEIFLKK